MECPECHGDGRVLLFTSAQPCDVCAGTGEVGYSENGGTEGKFTPIPGDEVFTGGGTITIGDATAAGTSTITGGSSPFWVSETSSTTNMSLTYVDDGGATFSFLCGRTNPLSGDLTAPRGCLYMLDDGRTASLWLKASERENDWVQIQTQATDHKLPSAEPAPENHTREEIVSRVTALKQQYDALLEEYKSEEISYEDFCRRTHDLQFSWLTTLDPLSIETMADLMSMIEEKGEEVVAFVISPQGLSDVRKFDSPKMSWEGREVFLFGVPFYAASKLSPGMVVAVGTEGSLAFAEHAIDMR